MPNWIHTAIEVSGEPAQLRAFLATVCRGRRFDFNRIKPMPGILQPIPANCDPVLTPEQEAEQAALRAQGYTNGDDWAKAHWGTACNPIETNIDTDGIEQGSVALFLRTSWTPPFMIFAHLLRMFPRLTFHASWCDPINDYDAERMPTLADICDELEAAYRKLYREGT